MEPGFSATPSATRPFLNCPEGPCDAITDPPVTETKAGFELPGGPALEGHGEKGGYDPADLQSAYKIPTSGGSGQTVAVVDAYGDSHAEVDLEKYRSKYGLTACTHASGCFKKLNEKGEEANYPANSSEWIPETALDLAMVSAGCPECHIMLVEASSANPENMAASVNRAVEAGATEVSNSYAYTETVCEGEIPSCGTFNADYNHPETVITAASGDYGYDFSGFGGYTEFYYSPAFPASSQYVVAVGGTKLSEAKNARGWSESVWNEPSKVGTSEISGTGSGCSKHRPKPSWQTDTGCKNRTENDTSAIGSCETPVSVYVHDLLGGLLGEWDNDCGTSAASPLIAAIDAHATAYTRDLNAAAFYKNPSLFDVTAGSNGSCGSEASSTWYLCNAKEGYDGPTGNGTPDGVMEVTGAPFVITSTASGLKATEGTLRSRLNPGGFETKYYFEYGKTTSYGTKTAEVSVGAGTGNLEESKAISGLSQSTTYHFRAVATNSKGTTDGEDQLFVTKEGPPENTTLPVASPATPDQAVPETTTTGTWTNKPTGYKYQWERCNSSGAECVNISGATNSTYTPVKEDVEHTLIVKVSAENVEGTGSAHSKATNKVEPLGKVIEYSLPEKSQPIGITKGPDGNLWFTDYGTNKIGKITTSGTISEYVEEHARQPIAITTGPDGNLWYSTADGSYAGKVTTAGAITYYLITGMANGRYIASGPGETIWLTATEGKIGKMNTSGEITKYTVSEGEPPAIPTGITKGPDGNMWFTNEGFGKIGKITAAGAITEYALAAGSAPYAITEGPDGNLWFTKGSGSGKITTAGSITEYAGGGGRGIATGPDGDLWVASGNTIKRMTTSGSVTEYSLPSGSNAWNIVRGPDENMWFTDYGTNKIGKITP